MIAENSLPGRPRLPGFTLPNDSFFKQHFLAEIGFPQHIELFEEHGFDSLDHLQGLVAADLASLGLAFADAQAILGALQVQLTGALQPPVAAVPAQLESVPTTPNDGQTLTDENGHDLDAWLAHFEETGQVLVPADRLLDELLSACNAPGSRLSVVRSSKEAAQLDAWLSQYEAGSMPEVTGQQILAEAESAGIRRGSIGLGAFDRMLQNFNTAGDAEEVFAELETAYQTERMPVDPPKGTSRTDSVDDIRYQEPSPLKAKAPEHHPRPAARNSFQQVHHS